ncbi:uncharacterized protein LOC102678927 [Apis dorsata]|uniref:uncharacterized protein LOC102678927 n=1 Tax=Apis dorsata TaxID=7462 RepID=UPI0003DF5E60|nr:uncharacterized protein LOC102678927 [Apis dorsata]
MLLYVTYVILLSGILSKSFLQVNAAPATYDQRQNGDFNVDAKFDNFLIVVATSGNGLFFRNLASQMLEMNELIPQYSKQQISEKPSETLVYETENADGGRGPYHVEIVHIEKEGDKDKHPELPDAKNSEKIELLKGTKNSETILQETTNSEILIDSKKAIKKTKQISNDTELHLIIDSSMKENKRSANARNLQVENFDRSDDLPVKEDISKATKPGISLKKQLSKEEEEDIPLISEERNELDNKRQELVLLGGGIENCGPGRYRDKFGICQNDKNYKEIYPI